MGTNQIRSQKSHLRTTAGLALGVTLLVLATVQVTRAHHAFVAEFDPNQPVLLEGNITKFDWVNPHSWIYVDVKEQSGQIANWAVETGSPNALFRAGWKKDSLKVGEKIIVKGFRGRGKGVRRANGVNVTFPDGQSVFAASSAPESARSDATVYIRP